MNFVNNNLFAKIKFLILEERCRKLRESRLNGDDNIGNNQTNSNNDYSPCSSKKMKITKKPKRKLKDDSEEEDEDEYNSDEVDEDDLEYDDDVNDRDFKI